MSKFDQHSKVSIEDLLKLKKTERPAADFWVGFERELRQKQLSALVEKRSWWQDLPQLLMRRAYLPIGATAILTFTLVSVRYYSPTVVLIQNEDTVQSTNSNLSLIESTPAVPQQHPASVSSPMINRAESVAIAPINESPTSVSVASFPEPSSPKVESNFRLAERESESPSARSIAANLAHIEQSEPELINAVLGSRLSSPRVQVASASTAELVSIPTNSSKRARLLVAHYNDRQPEVTAPDSVRERLSRRWSDDEASDRFSRIGLKGDQFSVKF